MTLTLMYCGAGVVKNGKEVCCGDNLKEVNAALDVEGLSDLLGYFIDNVGDNVENDDNVGVNVNESDIGDNTFDFSIDLDGKDVDNNGKYWFFEVNDGTIDESNDTDDASTFAEDDTEVASSNEDCVDKWSKFDIAVAIVDDGSGDNDDLCCVNDDDINADDDNDDICGAKIENDRCASEKVDKNECEVDTGVAFET